jgi:hypothetical protein
MTVMFRYLFFILTTLLIVSCAKPYYGYSKSDWDSLSENDKAVVGYEYSKIIAYQKEQKHTDIIDASTHSVVDLGASE